MNWFIFNKQDWWNWVKAKCLFLVEPATVMTDLLTEADIVNHKKFSFARIEIERIWRHFSIAC